MIDIYTPRGTWVKFTDRVIDAQIKWGNHTDPRDLLDPTGIYIVDCTEIHSWHTKLFLQEFPGKSFNCAWFEEVKKEE